MDPNIPPNDPARKPSDPARKSAPSDPPPEVIERLETLDDVIFPAIDGDEQALAQVEPAWREAVAQLGPAAVQESRREYLRYARSTWEFLRTSAAGDRPRLMALLNLIALLSGVDL